MEPLEISPEELKTRLKGSPEIILLDVREPKEVNETPGLPGAVCMPLGDVPGRTHELDPESEIAVYCARGQRSASVAEFLRNRDFEHVRSLSGDLAAWNGVL